MEQLNIEKSITTEDMISSGWEYNRKEAIFTKGDLMAEGILDLTRDPSWMIIRITRGKIFLKDIPNTIYYGKIPTIKYLKQLEENI